MEFTHLDTKGNARMVDISDKPQSKRRAKAQAIVKVSQELIAKIKNQAIPKGDIFSISRVAGIMAAKKTDSLIPLCHSIPISSIEIHFNIVEEKEIIEIYSEVSTIFGTGVEMEALTSVSITALTIYDMCKAIDKRILISEIKLLEKTGGKSGDFFADNEIV